MLSTSVKGYLIPVLLPSEDQLPERLPVSGMETAKMQENRKVVMSTSAPAFGILSLLDVSGGCLLCPGGGNGWRFVASLVYEGLNRVFLLLQVADRHRCDVSPVDQGWKIPNPNGPFHDRRRGIWEQSDPGVPAMPLQCEKAEKMALAACIRRFRAIPSAMMRNGTRWGEFTSAVN